MGSKNQLIDEIFEICDSIMEHSFKNQQSLELLIKKHPLNETLQSYQLVPVTQFEDQSRNSLKQLSIEELKFLLEDAQQTLDQVMQEELQINKLGMRVPKKQIETKSYEQWNFLLQWPKSNNLDSIIMNVQSITNNIYAQLQKNANKQQDDNLEEQYKQALERIEYLELKLEEQNNQKEKTTVLNSNNKPNIKTKNKLELMDELENRLLVLEAEKEKMSSSSMEAFSKLLQYK